MMIKNREGQKVGDRGTGDDRLSRVLRQSIIGARGFHGRVRNGIGWDTSAMITGSSIPYLKKKLKFAFVQMQIIYTLSKSSQSDY